MRASLRPRYSDRMTTRTPGRRIVALLIPALALAGARAQEAQPEGALETRTAHPGLALGLRAQATLAARVVAPVVVIAEDERSYTEAIARWTPERIFPVLLDDGSWQTEEDIARFVRAFGAERVIRWRAHTEGDEPANSEGAILGSLARAWGLASGENDPRAALLARWGELGIEPVGVVACDPRDGAWTAALALAAGRAQPVVWMETRGSVNGTMSGAEGEALCARLESLCDEAGVSWRGLGSGIDAVTLCADVPGRIEQGQDAEGKAESVALTDRMGRDAGGARWAWCGQVFGTPARCAYAAMCSLFSPAREAWVFDGYGSGEPWGLYDGTEAGRLMEEAGLRATVCDEPGNTLGDWRARAGLPVSAGLILVNSSGNRNFFNLPGGRGLAGDVPMLTLPAACHMVHSWSAVSPGRRATLAGRWLERGVFVYAGSVHEPYLQAFVPTPVLTRRLLGGFAFGAAVRIDDGPVWRITVIGDPLWVLAPARAHSGEAPELTGSVAVDERMREDLLGERFAGGVRALVLLGRDSDAARLVEAARQDRPELLTAETARASLMALARTGMDDAFLAAYGALSAADAQDGAARDALWMVARRACRTPGERRERALALLALHVRPEQEEGDREELAQLGGAVGGPEGGGRNRGSRP